MDNKTKNFVNFFYSGLSVFYPEKVFGKKPLGTYDEVFEWQGWEKIEFEEYLLSKTKTSSVDEALKTVLSWKAEIEAGEYPKSNMPPQDVLEADVRLQQEVKTNPDKLTAAQLKKQALLKDRQRVETAANEIHLKPVEEIPEVTLNEAEQTRLENLVGVANSSPKVREKYADYLTNEIVKRLPEEARGDLSQEELRLVAKGIALDTLEKSLNIKQVLINLSGVYEALQNPNSEALKQIIPDQNLRFSVAKAAEILAVANAADVKQARVLLLLVFDKKIVDLLYGQDKKILFEIVTNPSQAAYTINRAELIANSQGLKELQTPTAGRLEISKRFSESLNSLLARIRSTSIFPQRIFPKEAGEKVFVTAILPAQQAFKNYSSYIKSEGLGALQLPFSFATGKLKNAAVSKISSKIGKTAFAKAIKEGGKAIAKRGIFAKAAGWLVKLSGVFGGIPGLIASFAIGELVSRVLSWMSKHKKETAAILLSPFLVAGMILGIPLLAFGAAAGMGIALLGGPTAVVTGAAGFASSIFIGLTSLVISSIAVPFVVALISIPLVIALILFIINSGAYIVPLGTSQIPGAIESPYIGIEKEALPNKIDNFSSPVTISYSVRIFAKKGALTNIKISNEYKVISRSNPPIPNPQIEEIANPPAIISPTKDYVFDYQISLGPEYNDSIVVDTLSVTADAPEQSGATTRISASVVIGNPPISCPVPGGYIKDGSYSSGDESQGHGSDGYWKRMGGKCLWSLPQTSGCRGPVNSGNVCSTQSQTCSFYGYAIDVFPTGSEEVLAPTINGKTVDWVFNGVTFSNGGGTAGYSYGYSSGPYTLLLTHLRSGANTSGKISSGDKIGQLFPQGGNTHLHLEFQEKGVYRRPEEFFCF